MKKLISLLLLIVLSLVAISCNSDKNDKTGMPLIDVDISEINTQQSSDVDLFNSLEFSDVSVEKDNVGWYRMTGTIKNNANVKINGQFKVSLYDDNNNLVDSSLISIPGTGGIKSGASASFSETVTQKDFSSYKFEDEVLLSGN